MNHHHFTNSVCSTICIAPKYLPCVIVREKAISRLLPPQVCRLHTMSTTQTRSCSIAPFHSSSTPASPSAFHTPPLSSASPTSPSASASPVPTPSLRQHMCPQEPLDGESEDVQLLRLQLREVRAWLARVVLDSTLLLGWWFLRTSRRLTYEPPHIVSPSKLQSYLWGPHTRLSL